jgi:hypothetical protein
MSDLVASTLASLNTGSCEQRLGDESQRLAESLWREPDEERVIISCARGFALCRLAGVLILLMRAYPIVWHGMWIVE